MKFLFILALALSGMLLTACISVEDSSRQANSPRTSNDFGMMRGMPCHQMGDGTWMGDCDENAAPLTGQLPGDSAGAMFAPVKSSSIVDIADGDTVTLSADMVTKRINGNVYTMYGYNGQMPGPAYRVKQGTTATVVFTNNIDQPTTVHWHGLRHDIKDDGVPGVSQDPIQPGETHTYTLAFPDDGIYWYHPHVREDMQQDAGLAGNIIVLPTDEYNPVNQEELIMLDDILIENRKLVPYGEETANFGIMGRYGNVLLANGETNYELTVQKGSVVRFYFTNVANVRPFKIEIPGATMKLVGGDLGQYENEEIVKSIVLAPAERVIVDVLFEESGVYPLQHRTPEKAYHLGLVTVTSDAVTISHAVDFRENTRNEAVIEEIASFKQYFDIPFANTYTLDMSMHGMTMQGMGMMRGHSEGGIEWEDDMQMRTPEGQVQWLLKDALGRTNEKAGMQAKVGDKVKIRLINPENGMHPMQHPIHLHGQRFLIVAIDGKQVENHVWKDTVLVPIGSTVDILVDVTNPGEWMLHCHIAEHLEAGMMTSFSVADENGMVPGGSHE